MVHAQATGKPASLALQQQSRGNLLEHSLIISEESIKFLPSFSCESQDSESHPLSFVLGVEL